MKHAHATPEYEKLKKRIKKALEASSKPSYKVRDGIDIYSTIEDGMEWRSAPAEPRKSQSQRVSFFPLTAASLTSDSPTNDSPTNTAPTPV